MVHRLRILSLLVASLLAGCGNASGASVSSPHPSRPSVTSESLLSFTARGSDLGAGWTETPTPNGASLAIDNGSHPCKKPYPSDSQRLGRNGVTILNSSGDPSQVASEVAFYKDGGGDAALTDIRAVLDSCSSYTQVNTEGATIAIEIHKLPSGSITVGDDRIIFDRRATLGGRSIYSVVFVLRVREYVATIFTVSGDPAKAGKLAGIAAGASADRLESAPAS